MKKMEEVKTIYNIDELTLNFCCPNSLFNKLSTLLLDIQEPREGYQVTLLEKDHEYNPTVIYLHLTYDNNKTIGVIRCEKEKQKATFWVDNEIFYTPFASNVEGKISSICLIEPILSDLGFDISTFTIERMKICRDSQWEVLSEIDALSNNPDYKPVIANQENENCYLTDMYYFSSEGSNQCEAQKLRKKKACIISNLIGTLRLRVFCLTDLIRDLTHEDYINDFNGFPMDDKRKVYRTEITFNEGQFQRYLSCDCQVERYDLTLGDFFTQNKLKELYDYFIYDLLRFEEKNSTKFICI